MTSHVGLRLLDTGLLMDENNIATHIAYAKCWHWLYMAILLNSIGANNSVMWRTKRRCLNDLWERLSFALMSFFRSSDLALRLVAHRIPMHEEEDGFLSAGGTYCSNYDELSDALDALIHIPLEDVYPDRAAFPQFACVRHNYSRCSLEAPHCEINAPRLSVMYKTISPGDTRALSC